MKPNANNASARGFTLLELSLVVAILLILAGLMLPALCRAKARARGTVCKSNLHQIGLALTMYVGDFQKYPRDGSWLAVALPAYARQTVLSYASNNRNIFHCPAQRLLAKSLLALDAIDPLSYGYNSYGSAGPGPQNFRLGISGSPPISVAEIRVPADMILLGDSGTETLWDMMINPNLLPPRADTAGTTINSWLPGRRHGGANILFCDGHLEQGAQERWIQKSDLARRRWNNDHEPHPESWWH